MFSNPGIIEVALYSLLWFAVGVVAGRNLTKKPAVAAAPAGRREARPSVRSASRSDSGRNGRGGEDRSDRRDDRYEGGTGEGIELYVGNLPYETSDKDLQRAFEKFGKVLSVRMIENRRNGKPKGFGFVEMGEQSAADAAVRAMNGADYQGRSLVVNEAKSTARRR